MADFKRDVAAAILDNMAAAAPAAAAGASANVTGVANATTLRDHLVASVNVKFAPNISLTQAQGAVEEVRHRIDKAVLKTGAADMYFSNWKTVRLACVNVGATNSSDESCESMLSKIAALSMPPVAAAAGVAAGVGGGTPTRSSALVWPYLVVAAVFMAVAAAVATMLPAVLKRSVTVVLDMPWPQLAASADIKQRFAVAARDALVDTVGGGLTLRDVTATAVTEAREPHGYYTAVHFTLNRPLALPGVPTLTALRHVFWARAVWPQHAPLLLGHQFVRQWSSTAVATSAPSAVAEGLLLEIEVRRAASAARITLPELADLVLREASMQEIDPAAEGGGMMPVSTRRRSSRNHYDV